MKIKTFKFEIIDDCTPSHIDKKVNEFLETVTPIDVKTSFSGQSIAMNDDSYHSSLEGHMFLMVVVVYNEKEKNIGEL